MKTINLAVNRKPVSASVEPRTQLADFLRDTLNLTGTHLGCEHGVCGACTLFIDGVPARSCITFAIACDGASITTIEGFDDDEIMRALREAFSREHALQCGYCTPGMLASARDTVMRMPDATGGALPSVARDIAYRAVRNRGTIGGSLSHADPSADWMTSLAAIGAEVLIRSAAGQRRLAIEDFMTGAFEVALDPSEILEAVRIPRLSRSARWGYYKICRKTGEFAQAIAAVLHDPQRSVFRAVIGATESRPIIFTNAASLFSDTPRAGFPTAFDAGAVARALSAAGMTDPFDNQIHVVALKRAVDRAHLA